MTSDENMENHPIRYFVLTHNPEGEPFPKGAQLQIEWSGFESSLGAFRRDGFLKVNALS